MQPQTSQSPMGGWSQPQSVGGQGYTVGDVLSPISVGGQNLGSGMQCFISCRNPWREMNFN